MAHTVAEEYKSSLNDLNFNSKPLINMLTMLADENKKHAALIVNTIINHINSVSAESMLPGLYLVDSIVKNLGDEYLKIFCEHITSLFSTVFEKVDESTRSLMFKLRQTWTDILPNKVLYNLDVSVKKMDPAWPITAKNPSKKILINPKFLDGSVQEKKDCDAPNTILKKEEIKIKQRQGEVLKQLLAKQEQLRQLELRKLQLTMKRKTTAIGPTSSSLNSFTQNHIRDPRMVKINTVPQNVATQKSSTNSVLQGKHTSNNEVVPPVSRISTEGKSTISVKSEILPSINNNKNRTNDNSSEENFLASNEQSMSQKKGTLKCKYDKVSVKNKLNISKDKIEDRCSSNESSIKTDIKFKNEITSGKTNEICPKEVTKVFKSIPKKKNTISDNNKNFQINASNITKKKSMLFPPKKEKVKTSPKSESKDTIFCKDKKISIDIKNESTTSNFNNESRKVQKEYMKIDESVNLSNSVSKPNTSDKTETAIIKTESYKSDVKNILHKDEDLRISSIPLNEEAPSKRVSKRENVVSEPSIESDKVHVPRKKFKTEDIENCNPDYRIDSPVLFGNEDQDLRQSENISVNETKSKDWSQYKASHPDEYRPARQEYLGKSRARKYHFSGSKPYQTEYDRHGSFRFSRGRYNSRRNVRRMHFLRSIRGRSFYNSSVGPVMFDSYVFLQQAEERFRNGRISESEYLDIRHDLQKMVESSNHHHFSDFVPKLQNISHYERNPGVPKLREECEDKNIFTAEASRVQGPSINPPAVRPFVLDGIERLIHFVDDRALILMDNKEPRELTFKDEQKTVYIEGVAKPFTLGFDGKSVEFEVDGRRHILRFGTPGRELYINNHPYDIKFGGPPIAARLEDGHIYKIRLSGPPPQVIIGDKPQYELFAKYHGNVGNPTFNEGSVSANKETKAESHYTTPESCSLQDIDMRVKPENVQQPDELVSKDSPFYSEDMKDIDWRHIPPSGNVESDKSLPRVFEDNVSDDFRTWHKEVNGNRTIFHEASSQSQKPMPEDSSTYQWQTSVQDHPSMHKNIDPPMHKNIDPPSSCSEESWYYKEQDKAGWQFKSYRKNKQLSHPEEYLTYQSPGSTVQNFDSRVEHFDDHRSNSFVSYSDRLPFQNKQTRHQECESSYGPWVSDIDIGTMHNEPPSQVQTHFSTVPQKALLPSPPFPPDYPSAIETSVLHQSSGIAKGAALFQNLASLPDSSGSEIKPSTSSSSDLRVDVESLLQKLVTAGIINTKPNEQPVAESFEAIISETADDKETEETDTTLEEIPEIKLTSDDLKVHNVGVISALHKGLQCATCGMRFKELQSDQYSRHLDWHFRMNRREKDGAKKAISRRWYYEVEDWIQFEEFEDFEERVPSYFELQADSNQPEVVEVPAVISVIATNDDQEACPVCSEKFQLFWVEEEEEWHFRDAVRHDSITYHPACYEDFKKTSEAEKNNAAQSSSGDLTMVDEDVTLLLSSLLDDVLKQIETDSEIHSEMEHCDSLGIIQKVPSVDFNSEEEILEGKPGEEEIIGLITESDMEIDADIPKTDSKMVVLQSGGITLKVKAESLQCHSPSNLSEKETKEDEDKPLEEEEIDFRPPTPDPKFEARPLVSRGRELSGLCCIM